MYPKERVKNSTLKIFKVRNIFRFYLQNFVFVYFIAGGGSGIA